MIFYKQFDKDFPEKTSWQACFLLFPPEQVLGVNSLLALLWANEIGLSIFQIKASLSHCLSYVRFLVPWETQIVLRLRQ